MVPQPQAFRDGSERTPHVVHIDDCHHEQEVHAKAYGGAILTSIKACIALERFYCDGGTSLHLFSRDDGSSNEDEDVQAAKQSR